MALAPADPRAGALGEQLEALRKIRAAVGPETPIIWTIFSPLMVLPFLMTGGRDQALGLLRSAPRAVERALGAMAETLAGYARACVEEGADGLFYATNVATQSLMSAGCGASSVPSTARGTARRGRALQSPPRVRRRHSLRRVLGLSVTAFPGPPCPPIPAPGRRTGRAVVGGFHQAPHRLGRGDELARRGAAGVAEMKGRWLLLGPDCSINPDTPGPAPAAGAAATK